MYLTDYFFCLYFFTYFAHFRYYVPLFGFSLNQITRKVFYYVLDFRLEFNTMASFIAYVLRNCRLGYIQHLRNLFLFHAQI